MKASIGKYRGVEWRRMRLCDVFLHLWKLKRRVYCICDEWGTPTGDHFDTLAELQKHVDEELE